MSGKKLTDEELKKAAGAGCAPDAADVRPWAGFALSSWESARLPVARRAAMRIGAFFMTSHLRRRG